MSLADDLESALTSTNVPPQSEAAVGLARKYAALLDEPVPAGKYRIPIHHLVKVFAHYRATIRMTPTEERGMEAAEATILNALAEHSVASDLGPKLLAALTALNLTLPATASGQKPEAQRVKPGDPLDEFRGEAGRLTLVREHGA